MARIMHQPVIEIQVACFGSVEPIKFLSSMTMWIFNSMKCLSMRVLWTVDVAEFEKSLEKELPNSPTFG